MSRALISRSPDLLRLQNDGYEVDVRSGHLLVHSVPYVNARGEIALGCAVSELTLAGDVTSRPGSHIVMFVGEHPCNRDGSEILQIKHQSHTMALAADLVAQHSFSNKPPQGYADYYEKMTRYIEIISAPAMSLRTDVTPRTYKVIEAAADDGVFNYVDTASTRAGIGAITAKLAMRRVAIVGLGGTGSFLLDLLAKTPVQEIHLYDGDLFLQHNAFRAPGAASIEELRDRPSKVAYHRANYAQMRRGIHAHREYIGEDNVSQLQGFDFVFLCMDTGPAKKLIIDALHAANTPFIDTGLGVQMLEDSLELWAICRVTTSTPAKQDHVARRISFAVPDEDGDYERNIQIADLNALTAAYAVIRWKKFCGFYQDLEHEHDSTYSTNCNLLTGDDVP
ncbi:ThiF family adenylyltransferase [Piscinibacter sp. HJYY11]|uniref:ThiF family adenylyltransferase n=1 Tax=Piscinibacter sp. HJYY11 TaxID=2801333 RepID=UPI00191FAFA9|nr:ThiF family adenylyltransferase [Piscinibacter sp. HJYY11]MBL0726617.1 ThiF family adenylyltransferase [Piscinibacter sp. HJYY11]